MSAIKPIETLYGGYKFRSRLEARWAVFFDALSIRYDYEPEGFELGNGERYLPDFWLKDLNLWVEIKPIDPTDYEMNLMYLLTQGTGQNGVILSGTPQSPIIDWYEQKVTSAYKAHVFMSTPMPPFSGFQMDCFVFWSDPMMPDFLKSKGYEPIIGDLTREIIDNWIALDQDYYRCEYGVEHPKWKYGYSQKDLLWVYNPKDRTYGFDLIIAYGGMVYATWASLTYAYDQAQTARFEYGETPRVKGWSDAHIPF